MSKARFDAVKLYDHLCVHRLALSVQQQRHVTWRQVGEELGFAHSTFNALKRGKVPSVPILVLLLTWMGVTDLAPYLERE